MKIKLELLIFLCLKLIFCSNIFCQNENIFIPYKEGENWGISDVKARMIISPNYDAPPIYNATTNTFKAKNLHGEKIISLKDKIIFQTKHSIVFFSENYFCIRKDNRSMLVNIQGENILDKEYYRVAVFKNKYVLAEDFNRTSSIFKIKYEEELTTHKIDSLLTHRMIMNDSTVIAYKNNHLKQKFIFNKNELKISNLIIESSKPKEEPIDISSRNYHNATSKYNGDSIFISSSIAPIYIGYNKNKLRVVKSLVYKETNFQKEGHRLIQDDTLKKQYHSVFPIRKRYSDKTNLQYNYNSETLPLHIHTEFVILQDSLQNYSIINYDGKDISNSYYDNILDKPIKLNCDSSIFICKKDSKWGMINKLDQVVMNFEYDSIVFPSNYINRSYNTPCFYPVSGIHTIKNLKHGISNFSSIELVPHEMDSIISQNNLAFYILIKDQKYGFYMGEITYKNLLSENLSISPTYVYPSFKNKIRGYIQIKNLILLSIEDKDGKLLGYANPNGIKYYKEKSS